MSFLLRARVLRPAPIACAVIAGLACFAAAARPADAAATLARGR
ncbi:MAG: hypothetical protein QM601_04915 [Pseudoxanthomonas sp.]